jgi:HAD superfamily hydrolase (TIGR01509 family)
VITVVAFDIMDTLLRDPFREALRAATGLDLAELRRRRDPGLYPAFERGELSEAAYWAAHHDAGLDIDPEAFHRVRRAGLRWLPGMQELLAALQGRVRRVTASNYPVWIEELAVGPLAGHLDEVLASHHLGARKPDPAFFVRLLGRLEVTAAEVAFVDDREENVTAAAAHGLAAHRFVDAAGVRSWLTELGVAVSG